MFTCISSVVIDKFTSNRSIPPVFISTIPVSPVPPLILDIVNLLLSDELVAVVNIASIRPALTESSDVFLLSTFSDIPTPIPFVLVLFVLRTNDNNLETVLSSVSSFDISIVLLNISPVLEYTTALPVCIVFVPLPVLISFR